MNRGRNLAGTGDLTAGGRRMSWIWNFARVGSRVSYQALKGGADEAAAC